MRLSNRFKHALQSGFGRVGHFFLHTYFRVTVEGLEHIPRHGGAVLIPNHSGFSGADALLLRLLIKERTGRSARILGHRAYFEISSKVRAIASWAHLSKAALKDGIRQLQNKRLLILFPEGEDGNFKTSILKYHLQPFHTGFMRMALQAKAPVIPCLVMGAEESFLNLSSFKVKFRSLSFRLPIPVNFVPLPVHWHIVFLPPISLAPCSEVPLPQFVRQIQHRMQHELSRQVKMRKSLF